MNTNAQLLPGLAKSAVQEFAQVESQQQVARDTWLMRVRCPAVAAQIRPGQFFMIRPPRGTDPLLGRPFALLDVYDDERGQPLGLEFGYTVIGKLTGLMSTWTAGDQLELWGPLGNGFPLPPDGHLLCVAGGIGQTPFVAVAREALAQRGYGVPTRRSRTQQVSLLYGARSAEYLAFVDRFERSHVRVRVSTDDGSAGHHGLVTELLQESLAEDGDRPDAVYCCGPELMMKAVAEICHAANLRCWLSLETPMACGFGACFSCVARVKVGETEWDYRRTCVEGPVFPADSLLL